AELVALVPPLFVTVTSTVPVPSGAPATIEVSECTVKLVALVDPNLTAVTVAKLVPVMVTAVPPGPLAGSTLVTVGRSTYVNWSAGLVALVPTPFVTVTSTVPVPGGDTALIE